MYHSVLKLVTRLKKPELYNVSYITIELLELGLKNVLLKHTLLRKWWFQKCFKKLLKIEATLEWAAATSYKLGLLPSYKLGYSLATSWVKLQAGLLPRKKVFPFKHGFCSYSVFIHVIFQGCIT